MKESEKMGEYGYSSVHPSSVPSYSSIPLPVWSPSYDGVVVHSFVHRMGDFLERMSRYQLLYGVATADAANLALNEKQLRFGLDLQVPWNILISKHITLVQSLQERNKILFDLVMMAYGGGGQTMSITSSSEPDDVPLEEGIVYRQMWVVQYYIHFMYVMSQHVGDLGTTHLLHPLKALFHSSIICKLQFGIFARYCLEVGIWSSPPECCIKKIKGKILYEPSLYVIYLALHYCRFSSIMTTYTNWQTSRQHPMDLRDSCVDAMTDSLFTVPMIETADYHSSLNPQSWMYVFGHQSKSSLHKLRLGSIHGDQLRYIFGDPLIQDRAEQKNYSALDRQISTILISYWSSFARNG